MSEKPKRDYRTGRITIEDAKKKFHEYYDKKATPRKGRPWGDYETPLGVVRAKLFDMMYTKKDKFLIKCNNTDKYDAKNDINPHECEKGSIKYMLDEGPKTFDAQHVDAFDEGVPFDFKYKDKDGAIKKRESVSKGHTKRKPDVDDSKSKIYGPRLGTNELYSEYFRKQYNTRKGKNMTPGTTEGLKVDRTRDSPKGLGNNLVDRYWDKYEEQKARGRLESPYERKNKKKVVVVEKARVLLNFTIGASDYFTSDQIHAIGTEPNKSYELMIKGGNIFIKVDEGGELNEESDEIEYSSQISYLQELGFFLPGKGSHSFNEELKGIRLFKLKLEQKVRKTKKKRKTKKIIDILLNITTGELSYDDDLSDTVFKTWYDTWKTDTKSKPLILNFWREYPHRTKIKIKEIEPIKEIQSGGRTNVYDGGIYSSSSDEYSIYSSDDE